MRRAADGRQRLAVAWALLLLPVLGPVLAGGAGCKSSRRTVTTPTLAGDGGAGPARGGAAPSIAVTVTGHEDPFARLTPEQTRRLQAGFKALRTRDWKAARGEFEAVLLGAPDYLAARLPLLRATAHEGDYDGAVRLYGELLARDLLGGMGRLDKARDLAPLRASPAWSHVPEVEAAARAAWVRDVARGLFFVARMRDPGRLVLDGETPVRPTQEAWQFDPVTNRYRRLTDTEGRVYAIHVAPDRRALSFLLVDRLRGGSDGRLIDAAVGYLDLTNLQTVGPFPLDHEVALVQLLFTASGEPMWRTEAAQLMVDATRTALVRSPRGPGEPHPPGGMTLADVDTVTHTDEVGGGAALSADGMVITVAGSAVPIRSARPIDAASLAWSPGHKRLAYAGVLDPCKALTAAKGDKAAWNELFVWQADKALAVRLSQAASYFGSAWIDDDHLAYEGGVGRDGRLHVADLSTRADVVLKPRAGAGLHGVPTLACATVEATAPAEPPPPPAPDETPPGD